MSSYRTGLAALAVVLGCANMTEPRPTGPVVLLETPYLFGPCAPVWTPATPPVQTTVVDFAFMSKPTTQQVQALARGGASVLYAFGSIIRVAIDVSAVQTVMAGPAKPYYAQTVVDTTNHSPSVTSYFCLDALAREATPGSRRRSQEYVPLAAGQPDLRR